MPVLETDPKMVRPTAEVEPAPAPESADAPSPWHLGWRGWKRVAKRVSKELETDHVSLLAAGGAFFAFLSIFPAALAALAIFGLFTDPTEVEQQFATFTSAMPESAQALVQEQMHRLAAGAEQSLSIGLVVGVVVALWSATKGMKATIEALNAAYDQTEHRGFFRLNVLALMLTVGAIIMLGVLVLLIAGVPPLLGRVGLESTMRTVIDLSRWPVLVVLFAGTVAFLYHIGPNRPPPRFRWVTPGSLLATGLFLGVSALFSLYVSNFGKYGETYGSVAAVAVLMLWLYLGAYAVLLGAEVNAEAEREAKGTQALTGQQPQPERPPEHVGRPVHGIRMEA